MEMDTGRYSRRAPDVDATQWDGSLDDAVDVFRFVKDHARKPLFRKLSAKMNVVIMEDDIEGTLTLPNGVGPDGSVMHRGDWIVKNPGGKFNIIGDAAFRKQFVRIGD